LKLQTYKTLGIRLLLTANRLLGSKIECHKDASMPFIESAYSVTQISVNAEIA